MASILTDRNSLSTSYAAWAASWITTRVKDTMIGEPVGPEQRRIEASTRPEQIVIGVVGVTGSGKSSFIQRLTQRADIEIGDGPDSGTNGLHLNDMEPSN
jgi:ribosome biogenesis GTPase A